ncbi:Sec14 cytosolic factor like [Actinidia chinensis var. chinensis]|uniref:Sec14 cytosolic factor like n=1 Tax=Actinidia chinensis var. chinensis TaxID=1590841 RepID=A0A2R6PF89_ACTCC|nr:Sec14 cytosolic factor like [Actinidia chinensis var. chinensis]
MGDSFDHPGSRKASEVPSINTNKRVSKTCLVASNPKSSTQKSTRHVVSTDHRRMGRGTAGDAALFLLKVAALETVRRFSRARCPFVWCGIQALQVLCYPPLKWIQRWAPFTGLVYSVQALSRPLLVLSIATAFSDQSGYSNITSDASNDSRGLEDSQASPDSDSELPSVQSTPETRILDETPESQSSTNWLFQLYEELENKGISLPERINEDELNSFFIAANGDFSCLMSSVKKTICWRETYNILSGKELDMWSNVVFWHGFDVNYRPCLIVRLGLACSSLSSHERPRFLQAVVSQVEHGILHLVDPENPRITVLVDCEGLSPLRLPMQMLRSCSSIFQDHFPNRLGFLLVIRLPPVVRVIAQTFIQVLKPSTRQKLKIEGEMYRKILMENFETLPSYLGGNCTCRRCSNLRICNMELHRINETNERQRKMNIISCEDIPSPHPSDPIDIHMTGYCDQALRAAVVGIIMLLVLIAFLAGLYDPESSPALPL